MLSDDARRDDVRDRVLSDHAFSESFRPRTRRAIIYRKQVVMGVSGSFFDPPTISASSGDIVTFIFGNGYVLSATLFLPRASPM
jgi:hypothetical protein